ncbi:hypothetical protein TNCV_4604681 [Trichonephila clavipes]|nr:hypothetical protein TNCV_4604681 [Trichonephila clavipes]
MHLRMGSGGWSKRFLQVGWIFCPYHRKDISDKRSASSRFILTTLFGQSIGDLITSNVNMRGDPLEVDVVCLRDLLQFEQNRNAGFIVCGRPASKM